MKKPIYTILCLLFLIVLNAQQYEVIYELKFQPNTEKDSLIIEETSLLIDPQQQISFYDNLGEQKIEDFKNEVRELLKKGASVSHINIDDAPKYSFAFSVLKNLKTQKHRFYEPVLMQTYTYDYELDLNWEITNEQKEILGYAGQKALLDFGGRQWIAYFTHEIPISDGPYKFHGLPGLILEIYSIDGDYAFEAKELYSVAKEIKTPQRALDLKLDKLNDYKKRVADKPSIARENLLQSSGITVSASFNGREISNAEANVGYDESVKEWMKNHNNPIEKDMIWLEK